MYKKWEAIKDFERHSAAMQIAALTPTYTQPPMTCMHDAVVKTMQSSTPS